MAVDNFPGDELPGIAGGVTVVIDALTREADDPVIVGQTAQTAWWSWTATGDGPVTVNTEGSSSTQGNDTVLGVYTGSTLGSLTTVATDDDRGTDLLSSVSFTAVAGRTYRVLVGHYNGSAVGTYQLNWLLVPVVPPFIGFFGLGTRSLVPNGYLHDLFSRVDGPLGDAPTGQSWYNQVGEFSISGGIARGLNGDSPRYVNAEPGTGAGADGVYRGVLGYNVNDVGFILMTFRGGSGGWIEFGAQPSSSTNYLLLERDASGDNLGVIGTNDTHPAAVAGDELSVELSGTSIVCKVNGVVVISTTSSTHLTQTAVGMRSTSGGFTEVEFVPA